ncbi:ABC transporter ATP-binding protein [Zwartia vadi]|uniref:ABC transporter ATP-binding protein n=1 Tax=Zwartia vadi TaxID=3058168 RepID=UPI0025B2C895|nr:ABC transporter ATP-binding protein [Zwartia vadi]MDN3987514.1 ABC transporter ATP-binding protein [Zwartia vadi]
MNSLYTNYSKLVLSAKSIGLAYGTSRPLIADFSLDVGAGEIVTVLGPSGIGKSSLLRIFAGLQSSNGGQIFAGDEEVTGAHPRVAMAFQDPSLLPWLTLEQNVAFGLDFKHQPKISAEVRQARVDLAIREVGLEHARQRYPRELSGGMAQRTALARCLARQPSVLLLDEPFGALDEVTRESMQALLLRVREDLGTAAVLITHDIDEALRVSDRVVLLGGTPAHVFGQWTLGCAQERDLLDPSVQALRLEILQALRRSIQGQPASLPSAFEFKLARPDYAHQEYSNVH